jgi:hypothetical protein
MAENIMPGETVYSRGIDDDCRPRITELTFVRYEVHGGTNPDGITYRYDCVVRCDNVLVRSNSEELYRNRSDVMRDGSSNFA